MEKKKKIVKIFLLSFLFFSGACIDTRPTYIRKRITQAIKEICKKEYHLNVEVKEKKDTIWIYADFDILLNKQGEIKENVSQKIRNILFSLERVIFSIDSPPTFYVFIGSGRKKELIIIGFIPDIVKFHFNLISQKEFLERRCIIIKDKKEKISEFNLTLPYFLALLIKQKIINFFSSPPYADLLILKECKVEYNPLEKSFYVVCDIEKKKTIDNFSPFEEILKICHYFIVEAYDFRDFLYINILEKNSGKNIVLSSRAFREKKIK